MILLCVTFRLMLQKSCGAQQKGVTASQSYELNPEQSCRLVSYTTYKARSTLGLPPVHIHNHQKRQTPLLNPFSNLYLSYFYIYTNQFLSLQSTENALQHAAFPGMGQEKVWRT